jgi:hypothetical protein
MQAGRSRRTGLIDKRVGCVNSVTADLQGKSMLARQLARAALCGPFVGTPRHALDTTSRPQTAFGEPSSQSKNSLQGAAAEFAHPTGRRATAARLTYRLWWQWQQVHPGVNPSLAGSGPASPVMDPWPTTKPPTRDITALGYTYV